MTHRRIAVITAVAVLAVVAQVPSTAFASTLPAECGESSGVVTCTYTSGDNAFVVPVGIATIHVAAVGGSGAIGGALLISTAPGRGARVEGDISVSAGSILHAVVGGNAVGVSGGSNGGGDAGIGVAGNGGGGGGASDLRTGTGVDTRVLIAGGGGGSGYHGVDTTGNGGDAGSDGTPTPQQAFAYSGGGGEAGCTSVAQTDCSLGGMAPANPGGAAGSSGVLGIGGGGGGVATGSFGGGGGGGGGGGFYGGGGGGGGRMNAANAGEFPGSGGGGGGGSNLVPSGASVSTDTTGVPSITISYASPTAPSFNVASAASAGNTTMTVTFDAPPDGPQAGTLANYSVPGLTLSGTPIVSANTVTITTSTQAAQTYTVTVTNVTSASGATPLSTTTADFTGTAPAAPPQANVSPASLSFGNVRVGTPSTSQVVTVSAAPGTGDLHIGQLGTIGANSIDFGVGADQCSNTTLTAGTSCTALVTFIPQARGSRTATLQVPDDAADTPQTVSLSGTGVAPVAIVTPSSLDFGTVEVGTTSPHRTITVTNTGDPGQDLMITAETLTPANTGFAIVSEHCATAGLIPAGTSCAIELTFTPPAAGARPATLSLTDDAAGSPHTVSLIGTGGVPSADLAVGISASPNPVKTGQKVTYTITLLNAGPSTASTILINDSLSSQSTFVSATISGGTCVTPVKGASGVVSCSLASLASGSTKPVQIVVTVIAKKTSITNTVTVSAATADPNLANNAASITTRLK